MPQDKWVTWGPQSNIQSMDVGSMDPKKISPTASLHPTGADKISFSQTLVEIPPNWPPSYCRYNKSSHRFTTTSTTRSCFRYGSLKNRRTKASVLHFRRCRWSYQQGAAWKPPIDTRRRWPRHHAARDLFWREWNRSSCKLFIMDRYGSLTNLPLTF